MRENDCFTEEYVDVPNVLGDIFKSLIGAIYLDSGREMDIVWKICYEFLNEEIGKLKIYAAFFFYIHKLYVIFKNVNL